MRRSKWERQMEKEFRFHLDSRIGELRNEGLSPKDAEARAKQEFGALDLAKEECRDQLPVEWLGDLWRDVRYCARSLRRTPGFAITAVVTLGLGMGANTAVFSLVHAVLLRALPYPQPERLVRIGEHERQSDVTVPEYQFWKEHAKSFSSVAAYRGGASESVVSGGREAWVPSLTISPDFFRTLGVHLASGREFNADESQPAGPAVAVISDRLRQLLGSSASVTVDGLSYSVIGVLPKSFWFPQAADLFVPLRPAGSVSDNGSNTGMIARLRPDVTLQQANGEMRTVAEDFRRLHVSAEDSKGWRGLSAAPFGTWLTGEIRLKLLLLFGAVGLLMLIAILNVASLILARVATRQKEIAIRRALGSSSGRLLRQFVVENVLISCSGGLAGLGAAYLLLKFLLSTIPFELHTAGDVQLDLPVMAFAFGAALLSGVIFTTAPLFASVKSDIFKTLRSAGQWGGGVRSYARSALVVVQVALSVTLLVGAALLIQSLYRLNSESLGFTPRGVMTFSTPQAAGRRQNAAAFLLFQDALLKRIGSVPGVRSVAVVNVLPLTSQNNFPTQRVGHPDESIGGMEIRLVTPGYFDALSIPVLRGRAFNDSDRSGSTPVILVNEVVARQWWAQGNPLGDEVAVGRFRGQDYGQDVVRQVVGVVGDTKSVYLKAPPRPTVYVPIEQAKWATWGMSWVVRANDLNTLPQQLRQAVADVDPKQPVADLRTLEEIVSSTKADSRFDAWLFGGFAALALVLSAVGLYGLLSFSVARRTNEIGTRVALGSHRSDVLRLILTEGLTLVAVGLVIGLAGAAAATRLLTGLLFGVRASDSSSYWMVSAVLLFVGLLASYLPAARAASVNPMTALRSE